MHDVADRPHAASLMAEPALVESALALRDEVRSYQGETERERRIPLQLVEQLREAGFYRMVVPRALGGLQVELATYLRVAEVIAEGDGSVGWNLANNAVGQLASLSLPDAGVEEVFRN